MKLIKLENYYQMVLKLNNKNRNISFKMEFTIVLKKFRVYILFCNGLCFINNVSNFDNRIDEKMGL